MVFFSKRVFCISSEMWSSTVPDCHLYCAMAALISCPSSSTDIA